MQSDANRALTNQLPGDVPSLMLPFADKTLLVPTVTVAEIIGYRRARAIENAPEWLMGFIQWREHSVPMMCLEVLCGEPMPEAHRFDRIAVLNYTGMSEDLPFVAIPTVGIPKLERVTSELLNMQDQPPANAFEKARVNLNGDDLVIPEVASLEEAYLSWQRENA